MDIYVVGVSMTPFGKFPEMSVKDLTRVAVNDALKDAGCEQSDIQAAFFAQTTQGVLQDQVFLPGPIALTAMGFQDIPMLTVENACGSGSTAFWEGINYLRSGAADVVLAVGAEKMNVGDQTKSLSIFEGGWDIECKEESLKTMLALGEGLEIPEGTTSKTPYSRFMDVYASFARYHMKHYGLTQHQIAAVCSKNHKHSVHNPRSFFHKEFSIEAVLGSRPIVYPLTLPMCAPVTDGGAAAILCTESALDQYGFDKSRAVKVYSCVLQSGRIAPYDTTETSVTARCARKAYEMAGGAPEDIDVAEVHDATAAARLEKAVSGRSEAIRQSAAGFPSILPVAWNRRVIRLALQDWDRFLSWSANFAENAACARWKERESLFRKTAVA
ncbi:MAG: thiolase family protein [Clostridiales bacterium]|nr:thiolase family protein [Clostridiales bacterium]